KESKYISFIIHSSGSTGLPKLIFQTQGAAVGNYAGNMNMFGFITHQQHSTFALLSVPSSTPKAMRSAKLGYAQGMGYAQSKLVGENLSAAAKRQTGIRARVLRVGQVMGDT